MKEKEIFMAILNSIIGILFIFAVAYLLSNNKKHIKWRTIIIGFLIQFGFALAVLKWSVGKYVLSKVALGVQSVIDYAQEGISFVFGSLANDGSIFFVNVLCVIIFISAVVSILYYLGIMQFVIRVIGGALSRLLGTSQLETISSSANIFLGQTEAPLLIKPYVSKLTESELFAVMVGGLASVSGSILVGYSMLGIPIEYLISAAFMAAPAGLIIAKILCPETEHDKVQNEVEMIKDNSANVVDAASKGAIDGLGLVLNIAAIILAFVAVIALINGLIGWIGGWFGVSDLSLQGILGWIFSPVAAIIGVPWGEAVTAGSLIGQKLILNEFVAFSNMAPLLPELSAKTTAIVTFALCGFANISSMGICISGISVFCPEKRNQLSKLAFRGMIGGFIVSLLSALIVGLIMAI